MPTSTVSGIDLIVGARSGSIQLLLYSVFRIGNATNNIRYDTFVKLSSDPAVAWTVPLSLGDSHRGFRVLGTTKYYFEHFRYSRDRALSLSKGDVFDQTLDAVLGSEVAKNLGYDIGDALVLAHSAGDVSLVEHNDKPFKVVGILERTGTPVDRTVHVSLAGITSIHENFKNGVPGRDTFSIESLDESKNLPKAITAFMLRLKKRPAIFQVQRYVNEYEDEPLMAILPGVALQELWDLMRIAESALRLVAIMVVVTGVLGMLVVVLSSLEARRREIAILRSVGARAVHVYTLLISEAGILVAGGVLAGLILHYGHLSALWLSYLIGQLL